jgi:hypothetical protein
MSMHPFTAGTLITPTHPTDYAPEQLLVVLECKGNGYGIGWYVVRYIDGTGPKEAHLHISDWQCV